MTPDSICHDYHDPATLTACIIKENFVIQAKAQLRHSWEEDSHFNGSNYLTP